MMVLIEVHHGHLSDANDSDANCALVSDYSYPYCQNSLTKN